MPRALVVDDSEVDRVMVGTLLAKNDHFEVDYAHHGAEALERMASSVPDLVVTDLAMPVMNGLELVARLKDEYPLVPVILVTSRGSEEIAVRALRDGAASYVPKRHLQQELSDVVATVLTISVEERNRARVMKNLRELETHFEIANERTLIPALVGYLTDTIAGMDLCDDAQQMRLGVALEEAIANAVDHGNLELDSRLREADRTAYEALARERAHHPPYADRRVTVQAHFSEKEVRFLVRDQGPGFDVGTLPDPTNPANLLKATGRGVLLMRTFMDEVSYNDTGNEVTLLKRCRHDR